MPRDVKPRRKTTARKAVGAAAGVIGGAGGLAAVLTSPLPVIVLGIIVLVVLMPLAAIVLTPVISENPDRCARATAVLDRLLATLPGSRPLRSAGGHPGATTDGITDDIAYGATGVITVDESWLQ